MTALHTSIFPNESVRLRDTTVTGLLEWTYRRQKADIMSGRGLWGPEAEIEAREEGRPLRRWSGCGCAQLEAIARLGTRVDTSGWQRSAVHADAELVHDLVIGISRRDWAGASLLQLYGRAGGVPEWACRQEFEPVRDARDRVIQDRFEETVSVSDSHGRRSKMPVRFCPVEKYPSDAWVEMIRAEYRTWHAALVALQGRLDDSHLTKWRVVGLGAEAEPWSRTI